MSEIRELTPAEIAVVTGGIFGTLMEAAQAVASAIGAAVEWVLDNFSFEIRDDGWTIGYPQ